MPDDRRGERAIALIAALQTILDELPQGSEAIDDPAEEMEEDVPAVKDPTHQLFFERLNQYSLASLFTSIRIIHHMHTAEPVAQ